MNQVIKIIEEVVCFIFLIRFTAINIWFGYLVYINQKKDPELKRDFSNLFVSFIELIVTVIIIVIVLFILVTLLKYLFYLGIIAFGVFIVIMVLIFLTYF